MGFRYHLLAALVAITFLGTRPAMADEGRVYAETGVGYITGDFGTPTRSNLYYLEATIGYVTPSYYLSAGLPYDVISYSGDGAAHGHGLGDAVLQAGKILYRHPGGTYLSGSAMIKLPTADEAEPLGTGEVDYGGQFGVTHPFNKYDMGFVGGYRVFGPSPGQNENHAYLYGAGVSRRFSKTYVSASIEGRTSIYLGAKDPLEFTLGAFRPLNRDYSVRGSALAGLSTGSPDFGLFIGLARWF